MNLFFRNQDGIAMRIMKNKSDIFLSIFETSSHKLSEGDLEKATKDCEEISELEYKRRVFSQSKYLDLSKVDGYEFDNYLQQYIEDEKLSEEEVEIGFNLSGGYVSFGEL